MLINGVQIDETFAEAFNMRGTRVIITAQNLKWAYHAANAMTGFATSVIGCGVEAGIERELNIEETPDGRPGLSILMFAMGSKVLMQQLEKQKIKKKEYKLALDIILESISLKQKKIPIRFN